MFSRRKAKIFRNICTKNTITESFNRPAVGDLKVPELEIIRIGAYNGIIPGGVTNEQGNRPGD